MRVFGGTTVISHHDLFWLRLVANRSGLVTLCQRAAEIQDRKTAQCGLWLWNCSFQNLLEA